MQEKWLRHPQAGYSLIELAVVLVIIGLIIGGVMKGRDLVENARLKALMTQIQSYRLANTTFFERYSALPGDFHQARELIESNLRNGDNDRIINNEEAVAYWKHLVATDLISSFSEERPSTKIGGYVSVAYSPADLKGHWFVVGTKQGTQYEGALFTPKQAFFIDKNFDSGDPRSGDIQFRDAQDADGHCLNGNQYNMTEERPVCVGYFKF